MSDHLTYDQWQAIRRAQKIDLKARSIFLHRTVPDAHPATNLLADWIVPSAEDRAEAERYVDDNPSFMENSGQAALTGMMGVGNSVLNWLRW